MKKFSIWVWLKNKYWYHIKYGLYKDEHRKYLCAFESARSAKMEMDKAAYHILDLNILRVRFLLTEQIDDIQQVEEVIAETNAAYKKLERELSVFEVALWKKLLKVALPKYSDDDIAKMFNMSLDKAAAFRTAFGDAKQ